MCAHIHSQNHANTWPVTTACTECVCDGACPRNCHKYHIGMDLESDGDADKLTEAAIMLMKSPRTLAIGYDTLPVIAEMDVSNSPGNSTSN